MAAVGSKDFYVRFVIEGRRCTEALDLPLTFEVRHAQVPPFLDGAFDAVMCRRSVPNSSTRLRRPGGVRDRSRENRGFLDPFHRFHRGRSSS